MSAESINVRIKGTLQSHTETWEWLKKELEPALRANDSEFIAVSAQDVIKRNCNR